MTMLAKYVLAICCTKNFNRGNGSAVYLRAQRYEFKYIVIIICFLLIIHPFGGTRIRGTRGNTGEPLQYLLCFQRPLKNECSMVAKQHVPLTRLIISNRIHQTCFLSLYASLGSMRNITQVSRNHDMSRVYRIIAILCFELPRSWTKNNVV